jgi:DNA-binding transcriptional LysR family regulator
MTDLYRTFVAVVENETLVEAAAVLHLTQPTVSRQLQQLEKAYEIPLFDRVGKRLILNRAGEHVYAFAKRTLALEQKLREDLNGLGDPTVGTVHLGAGLTPSLYLLPQVLSDYRKHYPRVQFQVRSLSSQATCNALLAHDIDLGIVTTFAGHTELTGSPLYVDDLLLVVGGNHPLTQQSSVTPRDFRTIPFVLMPKTSGLRRIIDDIAKRANIDLQVALETDSLESINRLVQVGLGASVLPRSAVKEDLGSGRLQVVKLEGVESVSRTITLVRRKEGTLPACTLQFAHLLESLGDSDWINPSQETSP